MSGTKRIKPWAAGCKARMLSDVIFRLLGFIQGVKMSLPIGFERKDDRKSEEITIPAATGSSVDTIIKKLIPIAEFDPVGQTAFKVNWISRKRVSLLEDWLRGCSTFL